MIAKYSEGWAKDVIHDFGDIIGYEEGRVPQRMEQAFIFHTIVPTKFNQDSYRKSPYRIHCENESVKTVVSIDQKTGERSRYVSHGDQDEIMDTLNLTDPRMVELYMDTFELNEVSSAIYLSNRNFCRVYNGLFKTWCKSY